MYVTCNSPYQTSNHYLNVKPTCSLNNWLTYLLTILISPFLLTFNSKRQP